MNFPLYKMRNLFDPSAPPENNPFANIDFSKQGGQDQPDDSVTPPAKAPDASRLEQIYGTLSKMSSGAASQKYRDFLDTAPDRKNFEPSKTQRLANMLSGVATGWHHPDKGISTMNALNDDKYNEAMYDYKDKAGRLEKGAELEEKDINNRAKTYRDILEDQDKQAATAGLNSYRDRYIASRDRATDQRRDASDASRRKPVNFFTNTATGHRMGITMNDDGSSNTLDFGVGAMTPDQTVENEGKKAGARANAQLPAQKALITARADEVRKNIQARLKSSKSLVEFKRSNPTFEFKETKEGNIVAFDKNDPSNTYDTGYQTNKLGDQEKMELGLKQKKELEADREKNRESLKATPPPDKKVTVSGNTATTTYKRTADNKLVPPKGYVRFRTPEGKGGIIPEAELKDHPTWVKE